MITTSEHFSVCMCEIQNKNEALNETLMIRRMY